MEICPRCLPGCTRPLLYMKSCLRQSRGRIVFQPTIIKGVFLKEYRAEKISTRCNVHKQNRWIPWPTLWARRTLQSFLRAADQRLLWIGNHVRNARIENGSILQWVALLKRKLILWERKTSNFFKKSKNQARISKNYKSRNPKWRQNKRDYKKLAMAKRWVWRPETFQI